MPSEKFLRNSNPIVSAELPRRKEKVSDKYEKLGYKDYTSAALHTKAKTAYGYFETKAKPMNSGGSSSFWFKRDATPGWNTEIEMDYAPKGLNEDIVRLISSKKNEPEWLLAWRLRAYERFLEMLAQLG